MVARKYILGVLVAVACELGSERHVGLAYLADNICFTGARLSRNTSKQTTTSPLCPMRNSAACLTRLSPKDPSLVSSLARRVRLFSQRSNQPSTACMLEKMPHLDRHLINVHVVSTSHRSHVIVAVHADYLRRVWSSKARQA